MSKKIGILEICEPNHYSAVNGLMKTYASDINNKVYVFSIAKINKPLKENGLLPNIELVEWDEKQESRTLFLDKIASLDLDRLHVCTISGDYKSFSKFKPKAKEIYTHIHNIDTWFDDTVGRAWKIMLFDLKHKTANRKRYRIVGRFFLETLLNSTYRKAYLNNLKERPHHFIVHSEGQMNMLSDFVPKEKITIFPFAIYEGLQDQSQGNTKLRICIPGIITSERREYKVFFNSLLERIQELKGKLLLDLLGYIPALEKEVMEVLIKNLQEAGIEVIYYPSFVFGQQFDTAISKADILLNNQKVEKNASGKYGVTKESGMIFNMLRGAKVGVIPHDYQVNEEFKASTLFFENYEKLGELIVEMVQSPEKIKALKSKATELSKMYSAESLYKRLRT